MGNMFGGSKMPPVVPTPLMPTPDDSAVKEAKRKSLAALSQQTGRASTILTDTGSNDKLGG